MWSRGCRYRHRLALIQENSPRAGQNVFRRNDSNAPGRKIHSQGAAQDRTISPEHIDAQGSIRVYELQNSLARRIEWMDMAKQEIARQGLRNGIKTPNDKINVVQVPRR